MKQKKDPQGASGPKDPKSKNSGTRPYEKTSGKSPSDPAKKKSAERTSSGSGKWEYPEETAQVKSRQVGNKNAGGYKQDELSHGRSAPDDEDEDEDYTGDVRDNEYLDDEDEEF